MHRMKKASACFPRIAGLQSSELAVMYRVSAGCANGGKGIAASVIQSALHISKPAVSHVLNGLEQKGYIIRSTDSDDRRKIVVVLTEEGEIQMTGALRCQDECLEYVFEQLGEENINMLIELVNRLLDILEDADVREYMERCG